MLNQLTICFRCKKETDGKYFTKYNQPLCLECFNNAKTKNNALEIVIKPEALDISSLNEDLIQKPLWRPSDFNEYIGQTNLKKILDAYIQGTQKMNKSFPHMFIDGKAGMGKTTIAYIIANKLKLPFVEALATTIESQQQFVDLLAKCQGGILFIDEIHMINKKVANFILPILEDFQINGKKIKQFSLFACTTEKGSLIKKYKPLIDRMKIQKTLEDYNEDELFILIKQYKNKAFNNIGLDDNVLIQISKNCRATPRIAIRYLESYIYMDKPIEEIFKSYDIIKDGITRDDIKVLSLLNTKEIGIGIKSICAYLGTSEENYLYQIEGYLLQKGLITINSRRQITDKGKEFLNGIT